MPFSIHITHHYHKITKPRGVDNSLKRILGPSTKAYVGYHASMAVNEFVLSLKGYEAINLKTGTSCCFGKHDYFQRKRRKNSDFQRRDNLPKTKCPEPGLRDQGFRCGAEEYTRMKTFETVIALQWEGEMEVSQEYLEVFMQ